MRILLHKNFKKSYAKFSSNQKEHIKKVLELFKENPHNPSLKNHALHGKDQGKRVISVGGDLRIVFEEEDNYENVICIRVGSHAQVY